MGVASRPEAVGEPQEVGLVDRAQDLGDRPLDDLVFQGRDTEWALSAVGLRDVGASHRLRLVAPRVHPRTEFAQIRREVLLIGTHRHPVDSRRCLAPLWPKRALERNLVDMV